jgi:pyruvate-formate lyase
MFHLPSTTKEEEGLPRECSLATLQRKLNLKLLETLQKLKNPQPETTARKHEKWENKSMN